MYQYKPKKRFACFHADTTNRLHRPAIRPSVRVTLACCSAAAALGLDVAALVDLDGARCFRCARGGPNAVLDFRRHRHECLLHVGGVLRRRLQEGDAQLVRVFHSRSGVHHLLRLQITLVAHQQLVHVLAGVALDLLQPLFHVVERFLVGAVVHHDDAVRAPVVRRRYRTEALLAGRVPNLQFDCFAIQVNGPNFKIYTDCADIAFRVCIVSKSQQKARLSHTRVSNQQQFE